MKLVHFADVHLGMENFGKLDVHTGLHSRVLDYLNALDALADAVEYICPDVVLFAGDAFKARAPNPTLVTQFASRLQRIADVSPVIMLVGNHDRIRGGHERKHSISIFQEIKANNEIIVSDTVERICIGDSMCVYTVPWFYDIDNNAVLDMLDGLDVGSAFNAVLGHLTVVGAETDSYSFSLDDTNTFECERVSLNGKADYVALGHVHKHQVISSDPLIIYSGSVERVDWSERNNDKGFVLVDTESGYEFISLRPRPMIDIHVEWRSIERITLYDVSDAIVRISVHAGGVAESAVHGAIHDLLGSSYYDLDGVIIIHNDDVARRPSISVDVSDMSEEDAASAYLCQYWKGKEYSEAKIRKLTKHAVELMGKVNDDRLGGRHNVV